VQYQLIAADSPAQLEKLVNNELNHGWIVTGGLVTYNVHSNDQILQPSSRFFAQAMIRPIPQHDKKPQTQDRGLAQRFRQRERTNCGRSYARRQRSSAARDPAELGSRSGRKWDPLLLPDDLPMKMALTAVVSHGRFVRLNSSCGILVRIRFVRLNSSCGILRSGPALEDFYLRCCLILWRKDAAKGSRKEGDHPTTGKGSSPTPRDGRARRRPREQSLRIDRAPDCRSAPDPRRGGRLPDGGHVRRDWDPKSVQEVSKKLTANATMFAPLSM
jgi:hypothetical protein